MTLLAGTHLGPYEVLGLLGAGGMGEVYRARDPRLGREVAVKVLSGDVVSDPERLQRFEREARAVAALNHPNVLTVFDVGTQPAGDSGTPGTPYVVTELLEGETLRELVSRRTPTQRQVLSFAVQVARGLDAAHEKGIVHRDLKPENVFVTTDGRAKVLDFGLAKLMDRLAGDSAEPTESSPRGPQERGSCWGRWGTCLRSRCGRSRWTTGRTSSRWVWCCTSFWAGSTRSGGTRRSGR